MKIGLLTCQTWPGLIEKEQQMAAFLRPELDAEVVVWNDPSVNWAGFDCLVFRTVWDYFEHPEAFSSWLDVIEQLDIPTFNPLSIVRENQHKFYLQSLEKAGINIIPTVFLPKGDALDLNFVAAHGWERAVIKPAVSAGSFWTKLFSAEQAESVTEEYRDIAQTRDLLVQPFMPEIQTQGEISMIFFENTFSHAVIKRPKGDDFRVQSQFGGLYQPYQPDAKTLQTAQHIVAVAGKNTLYARVDGLLRGGDFWLMEIEMIEPDLYFDYHPEAKNNYRKALVNLALGQ